VASRRFRLLDTMIQQINKIGWLAAEVGLMLIALCTLLHIILGSSSGSFISSVAGNATEFLQKIPPGTFLGLFLILVLYNLVKSRIKS
jgi:hypothetical protein